MKYTNLVRDLLDEPINALNTGSTGLEAFEHLIHKLTNYYDDSEVPAAIREIRAFTVPFDTAYRTYLRQYQSRIENALSGDSKYHPMTPTIVEVIRYDVHDYCYEVVTAMFDDEKAQSNYFASLDQVLVLLKAKLNKRIYVTESPAQAAAPTVQPGSQKYTQTVNPVGSFAPLLRLRRIRRTRSNTTSIHDPQMALFTSMFYPFCPQLDLDFHAYSDSSMIRMSGAVDLGVAWDGV